MWLINILLEKLSKSEAKLQRFATINRLSICKEIVMTTICNTFATEIYLLIFNGFTTDKHLLIYNEFAIEIHIYIYISICNTNIFVICNGFVMDNKCWLEMDLQL